ncbi:MAG: trypsin-like peptidase domain-containing protein [Thermobispora bispora]|jgi:S1-C subfamily serine protease|uniref:PDZ/DHR/GLGF domain protein n=1 Tax=Thermobispora bispora (strain ATCC 19993 / DSM 43833 / CBS 139.67 / JCM 10125 / KCTC 9307 / NBRC 14880 / R51) TaxID=469371 RepID=D6Y6F0_THEBD|nr:PDZ/DHR/GLGF domain protein [Thermobispora bispora DSM 43833]MBO2472862.1 PDZ domain-containing protein [Actinomycetales bacterium]MBX6169406.1 trypsin-like peptidase domain-containing protein [Thermobispora bispora]
MRISRLSAWTVAAALLIGATGCQADADGGDAAGEATSATQVTTPAPTSAALLPEPPAEVSALQSRYEQVIKAVLPSIVQVTTSESLGSGVVFDAEGHIITNAHVLGRAREAEVTLATGGEPKRAELVNLFPAGDLAVLKVADPSGLTPARFGRSSEVQVGQIVLALGNPLGYSGSVTQGIVSALGRTVSAPAQNGLPGATIIDAIQTSAPINRGNSGGALVDLRGQVVGIPTLAAVDPQLGAAPGIGFAIPSDTAVDIARQIIQHGKVVNSRRAALGISAGTAIDLFGNPTGVLVSAVTPGGAADRAGIRPGDVILSINGRPTRTSYTLSQILATYKPGETVRVELRRAFGRTTTVEVTLEELPS